MPYMIYEDSLSRMYGAPGSGKSFVALDMALSWAAGRAWGGRLLKPATTMYVMAEGQAVNMDRLEAWQSCHGVTDERLEGRFFLVPDAVQLTEYAVAPLVEWVGEHQPKLVVLDTKNAMMIGEENSATDFAVMRRALDLIRKAAGCCVMLIDHTGYEGTRARGSSAGTAGMDTEIRVEMNDERPALITATVTRDKAAEAGHAMAWRLTPQHPAAVLVSTDVPAKAVPTDALDWTIHTTEADVPQNVRDFRGKGQGLVVDVARALIFETSTVNDPNGNGVDLTKIRSMFPKTSRNTVDHAWSALQKMGYLVSVYPAPTVTQGASGKHGWSARNGS